MEKTINFTDWVCKNCSRTSDGLYWYSDSHVTGPLTIETLYNHWELHINKT